MRLLANIALYFICIGVALYAAVAYGFFPLGLLVLPEMKATFQAHAVGIYLHVFASIVALGLGPFQFSSYLRQKYLRVHRGSGRAYLFIGVLGGGIAGLYMAQFAFGGLTSRVGFTLLAVVWLYSGLMAYRAIRRHDIELHRTWMVRNFSLTLAAVALRGYLGLFFAAGFAFEDFYPVLAWLCWVPNVLVAEWFFNNRVRNSPPK